MKKNKNVKDIPLLTPSSVTRSSNSPYPSNTNERPPKNTNSCCIIV